MEKMKINLDVFEKSLQRLIEGVPQLLFFGQATSLSASLSMAIMDALKTCVSAESALPRTYVLQVNRTTLMQVSSFDQYAEGLAGAIASAAAEQGLFYDSPPQVTIQLLDTISVNEFRIVAVPVEKEQTDGKTSFIRVLPDDAPASQNAVPLEAVLIMNGEDVYPLEGLVVNIGRREDNHLIIPDMRVSRNHAQLRLIKDQYVIFDLDSTGGTFVNSHRITQRVLQPGDVISLAGYTMIYNENRMERDDITERIVKK